MMTRTVRSRPRNLVPTLSLWTTLCLAACGSSGGDGHGGSTSGTAGATGAAGTTGSGGTNGAAGASSATGTAGTVGVAGAAGTTAGRGGAMATGGAAAGSGGGSGAQGGARGSGAAGGMAGSSARGGATGTDGGPCGAGTSAAFPSVSDYTARDGGFGPALTTRNTADAALGTDRVAVFRPAAAKYGLGYQTNNISAKMAAATRALMPRWVSAACARVNRARFSGAKGFKGTPCLSGCRGCL